MYVQSIEQRNILCMHTHIRLHTLAGCFKYVFLNGSEMECNKMYSGQNWIDRPAPAMRCTHTCNVRLFHINTYFPSFPNMFPLRVGLRPNCVFNIVWTHTFTFYFFSSSFSFSFVSAISAFRFMHLHWRHPHTDPSPSAWSSFHLDEMYFVPMYVLLCLYIKLIIALLCYLHS